MELYSFGKPNISGVLAMIFRAKSDLQFRRNQLLFYINKNEFIEELLSLLEKPEIYSKIISELKIQEIYQNYKDKEIKLRTILINDMNILEFTLLQLVMILLNNLRIEENQGKNDISSAIKSQADDIVPQMQTKGLNKTEILKIMDSLKYMAANSANIFLDMQIHEKYYQILSKAIVWNFSDRSFAEEIFEKLDSAFRNFEKITKRNNSFIESYEMDESIRDSVSQNLIETVMELIPGYEERQAIQTDLQNSKLIESDLVSVLQSNNVLI